MMEIDKSLSKEKSEKNNEEKVVKQLKVSAKRQITIPKRFYDKLGINQEVICELRGNEIVLRGVPQTEDLSEKILEDRSEEHTSELQSRGHLVCRLLLE